MKRQAARRSWSSERVTNALAVLLGSSERPSVIDELIRSVPRACIRRPGITLAAMLGLVLLAAPGLAFLRLMTDGQALVPRDDPAVRLDAAIREHFDLRDPIVVFIASSHPDGIFNTETLATVRRISTALEALEPIGPAHVMSLATERSDRIYPGTLKTRRFLEPPPDTPERLDELRASIEAAAIVRGTLVADDGRAAAILVGVPPGSATGDRKTLYRRIRDIATAQGSPHDRIAVVGAPVAEALLGTHLLEDLALLIPLSIALIALVVGWGCGRIRGVALALGEVGACLIFTFGCMGWAGVPVYLTIAVLPVILTSIGLADEIHIFWHYQRVLAGDDAAPHPRAVERTMDSLARPVVLTSLTTSIGFVSFLASPIHPVRVFGAVAALGIVFCMIWSLTAIPALLALASPESLRRPGAAPGGGAIVRVLTAPGRHRVATLAVVIAISVAAGVGISRLQVQDSWLDGFARDSEFRRAVDEVNANLHGTHVLLARLAFDADAGASPLLEPAVVEAIGDFERFARALPGVGGVLGAHSHFTTVHYLLNARREGTRTLPEDSVGMKYLLVYFDKMRGAQRRAQIVDDDLRQTVVTLFLRDANYRDTARLMRQLETYAATRLEPFGARIDFAGDVAVSQAMIPAVVETQLNSLALALVLALVTLGLLLRSARQAVLAILPCTLAAGWVLGALGWLGIPLGVATSMFFVITLGIGVDYAVHFLEAVRRHRRDSPNEATARAAREVGPAIVADTLALALGFGLLTVSSVPANARLGLLVALALVAACVLTLGGLGALLGPRRVVGAPADAKRPGPER